MEARRTKVIFIGPASVGKTSLIYCQLKATHLCGEQFLPTLGVPSHDITVRLPNPPSEVPLYVFDTAGQERFGPMQQIYYRDVAVAVLCFDPSQPDWISKAEVCIGLLREVNAECDIIAAATKFDIWGDNTDLAALERAVEKKLRIPHLIVTSAMTGYQISEAFQVVAEVAAARSKKIQIETLLIPAQTPSTCPC
jgi:small GTP-binding protein